MRKIHMVKVVLTGTVLSFSLCQNTKAQNIDSLYIRSVFTEALSDTTAYHNLTVLSTSYPGRLCCSDAVEEALVWSEKEMMNLGADTVYRQDVMVKCWKRGKDERGEIVLAGGIRKNIHVCTLGLSVGTTDKGLEAEIIEVSSLEELKELGKEKISGKIVFFNRAMDPSHYYTFRGYGGAADQRTKGAAEASKYGAVAVLVRSLTLRNDTFPHTGVMRYGDAENKIPAFSIATADADKLHTYLQKEKTVKVWLKSECTTGEDQPSANVIAEIRGTEFPDQYITVGGHIDCWDNSLGAHDDAAGCIQSMEVIRLFRETGYKPKHTIRIVMFMDEEVAQRGAIRYAELVEKNKEIHIAAIESDRGADAPTGFSADVNDSVYAIFSEWFTFFNDYGMYQFIRGGSGVDIGPLKKFGVPLFAIMPESQRYFDFHHCAYDTPDKVHPRELQLGSAAIASLIYLIDKYAWNGTP